jgi:hypothetical protein
LSASCCKYDSDDSLTGNSIITATAGWGIISSAHSSVERTSIKLTCDISRPSFDA